MIVLREIVESDIDRITELCQDPDIQNFIYNMPRPYTKEDAAFYVNQLVEPGYTFAIARESNDELIGTIAINRSKLKSYEVSIGYWMGVEYRNHGYTTQAAKLVMEKILKEMNVRRIFAIHNVGNLASGAVMKKAGLEYEGRLRNYILDQGEFKDVEIYAYINDNYKL